MKNSGFFELNRLPENTALGYVKDDNGWRTNIYNLPIVGGGDGAWQIISEIKDFFLY